jgi:superoxide dismutase, Cu-Zn family
MSRLRAGLAFVALLVLAGATVAFAGTAGGEQRGAAGDDDRRGVQRGHGHGHGKHGDWRGRFGSFASARLVDAAGERVGKVWFKERGRSGEVAVFATVQDLPPGFHGFHVHAVGDCTGPTFTSAGGHHNPDDANHGDHAGDLPTLLVNADGSGMLATVTDRFSLAELKEGDGSAVMVHELPDNYANIPDRYAPEPDEETLSTGDAGSRLACGELR